ncbi:MAG: hypothetical protein QNJ84_15675 [Alphaproteobacteria bacterium]|nr:hypothetical protein [Alphaproteobacteria bacterium]
MALCGYRTGFITDQTRPSWDQEKGRPIAWSAWYPAAETGSIVRPPDNLFDTGAVSLNAPMLGTGKHPVVLLSHGTGGTGESLGWLARSLASENYIVIAANHHGNTSLEPYQAEGFLCWWERAIDLSALLSTLATESAFAGRLDLTCVSAVGFSLGGYTVLALAGARSAVQNFDLWRRQNAIKRAGPREFPDLADHVARLLKTSGAFRQSWDRQSDDFSDARITSIVALAPAPPVRAFTTQSVAQIDRPVTLITGGADQEAPTRHCAGWLSSQNSRFTHHDLGEHVGHYTFLDMPSDRSLIGTEDIFTDHNSINRREIHRLAARTVLRAVKSAQGSTGKSS